MEEFENCRITPEEDLDISDKAGRVFNNPIILETISKYLDTISIKTVCLVSKTWKEVIEREKFWRWATLIVDRNNYQEVTETRRIQLVSGIRIEDDTYLGHILEHIAAGDFPQIRSLDTSNLPASNETLLDVNVLTGTLLRLERCRMKTLTAAQCESLFAAMLDCEDFKLKTLYVTEGEFSGVPLNILIDGLIKLEDTNIAGFLDDHQLNSLFHQMSLSPVVNLRTFNIGGDSVSSAAVSSVPPHIFSSALVRVEQVTIDTTLGLAEEQTATLFDLISTSHNIKLKRLRFIGDFSDIPPALICNSVVALERCEDHCSLHSDQLLNIVEKIGCDCGLKELALAARNSETSSVPSEIISVAVERLASTGTSLPLNKVLSFKLWRRLVKSWGKSGKYIVFPISSTE